jgi:hypothetical protein
MATTNDRHEVEVDVKDNASRKLQTIGRSTGQMARDFSGAQRAAASLGRGMGVLTLASVKLANDAEVSLTRLQESIESNGESWDDLSGSIGEATDQALAFGFDDEDALDALNKITQATGDTEEALKGLAIAQDLARARGISLAQAADLVAKAEQGRFAALARVGIVIDENATKEQALAQLQERYAGQAEAYAETNAAAWDRFGNAVENKLETVGGALADIQGPLIALGAGAQVLGPLGDALGAVGAKAKLASVGTTLMNSSLFGPVGMIAATAAVVGGLILFSDNNESAAISSAELGNVIDNTTGSIYKQRDAFEALGLSMEAETAARFFETFVTSGTHAENVRFALEELTVSVGLLNKEIDGSVGDLSEFDARWIDSAFGNGDAKLSVDEVNAALNAFTEDMGLSADEVAAFTEDWNELMSRTLNQNFNGAAILREVNKIMGDTTLTADQQAEAIDNLVKSNYGYIESVEAVGQAITGVRPTLQDVETQFFTTTAMALEFNDAMGQAPPTLDDVIDGLQGSTVATDQMAVGMRTLKDESAAMNALLQTLSESLQVDVSEAASHAYGMVVGFTEGMVKSIGTSKEWIDSFVDAENNQQILGDLLTRNRIDLEDYREVMESQTRITDANVRATDAMNVIWAKQSDIVADGAVATADYIENLSKMDEAEQTLALAWADQDLAGRANEIAAMAREWGDMSAAQQEGFEQMVTSAAAVDPLLADMLESLGLIKADVNDPTGWTLVTNTEDAESDLDRVADAIDDLVDTLNDIYLLNVDENDNTGDMRTRIDAWVDAAHDATVSVHADTSPFDRGIAGRTGHQGDAFITVYTDSTPYDSNPYRQHGGLLPPDFDTARTGRQMRGPVLVGEAGPELLLPGNIISPASSVPGYGAGLARHERASAGAPVFSGPITVVANSPMQVATQLRPYARHAMRQ